MRKWVRRKLRDCGIELPFTAVICPHYVKRIEFDRERAEVAVEQTLVFLESPEPGDLREVVPLPPDADGQIHLSPETLELGRRTTPNDTTVYWAPRAPIVPYGLYVHKYAWSVAAPSAQAAVYTEFRCERRTGVAMLEVRTPGTFETAVAFRWPSWRRMQSVQALVKHALKQLEQSQGERPEILDDGSRLLWTLTGPRAGERYACVAFHQDGVALWQNRIEASSLPARMRRLVRTLTWS